MRLMTELFSDKEVSEDSAVIAALTTIVNKYYPGTKITNIEELK
jgi:hypothetical protein